MSSYPTLGELVGRVVADRGEHPFIVSGGEAVSYAQFDERVGRVAAGLASHGVAFRVAATGSR